MSYKQGDKIGAESYYDACQYVNEYNKTSDYNDKLDVVMLPDGGYEIQQMDLDQKKSLVRAKIDEIKKDIAENWDYKQLKYLRGEIDAAEWETIKTEIHNRTEHINELESIIEHIGD